jgi:ribosome biogenesis GTPase
MTGKVYKSTGSWYIIRTADGAVWNARLKGVFKLDEITSTNPLAVGDEIDFDPENEEERTGIITGIHDRRNYINRQSPSHKMQHHIVAANIDQCLLICTLKEPRTSLGFIDRFLVTAEAYHIPALLIFNKADLYRNKEKEKFEQWKAMYETIGYKTILMSIQTGLGVEEARGTLQGKITLLSGHSGVGKSSFINAVFPSLLLKTQHVSGWSGKGIHTTTFAEMFDLPTEGTAEQALSAGEQPAEAARYPAGGRLIDTPGMREFGLVNISRQELSGYFPEMLALSGRCQFNNCLHMNEPGCAVKAATEKGLIHIDRYVSYCSILDSIEEHSY